MGNQNLDLLDALGTMDLLLDRVEAVLYDLVNGYFLTSPRLSRKDRQCLILCDYERSGKKVDIAVDYLHRVQELVGSAMEKADTMDE